MIPITPKPRPGAVPVVFAKNQPQYLQLPANVVGDYVETKWKLTLKERLNILLRGTFYLTLLTFGRDLQPINLSTERQEL